MTAQPTPRRTPQSGRLAARREVRKARQARLFAFDGGGGGGGVARGDRHAPGTVAALGMWIALAPLLMFFLSLVSAYVVRQGLGSGWGSFAVPGVFWVNTIVLLASSASVEVARRRVMAGSEIILPGGGVSRITEVSTGTGVSPYLWITLALGILFLAGQIAGWRELSGSGVSIGSTPYGSYLYLLTGAHAVHLAVGLLGLLTAAAWPSAGRIAARRPAVVRASAIYWHFLDVVWLGLFSLLVFWR